MHDAKLKVNMGSYPGSKSRAGPQKSYQHVSAVGVVAMAYCIDDSLAYGRPTGIPTVLCVPVILRFSSPS